MAIATPLAGTSPYQAILGDAFASLHPNVRRAHLVPLAARGTLDVEHASHRLVPVLVALMSLPAAGQALPVRLVAEAVGDRVEWTRRIGSSVLRTWQRASGSRVVEHHGIGRVAFDLTVEDGALAYRQAWIQAGPVGVPRVVRPDVRARVSPADAGWRVDVTVMWRGHLVCHYHGVMEVA